MLSNGFARTAGTCDRTLQICKAIGGIGTGFISLSLPLTDAVVEDCKSWTDDTFAISLTQVRILTQPKPTERTKELADALARARMLEGREKDALHQDFELMALRSKINTWLKSEGLGRFVLTSS